VIESSTSVSSALAHISSLMQQGNLPQAAEACVAVLAASPDNSTATHLLGLARARMGQPDAERLIRRSIELEPANPEFQINFANFLRRRSRLSEAELEYRKALQMVPAARNARHNLALTLNELGRLPEAEAECRRVLLHHERDAEAWSLLGFILTNQKRLTEAEVAYRRALQLNPRYAVAHHNLGSLLIQTDRAEEALGALDRAQTLGTPDFELLFSRGRALTLLYRLDEAEDCFAKAVVVRQGHVEAQLNLARLRFMRADPDFTRGLTAAIGSAPDDLKLQALLATVLFRAGQYPAAEARIRDVLKRTDPPPQFRALLAQVLFEAGRLAEAETEAMEAAAALPRDSETVEILVSILLSRGRAEDAIPFIHVQRSREPDVQSWIAYEATAARLLNRPIYKSLFNYERFVRTWRPEAPAGWSSMQELNAALVTALRARHRLISHPLDQSLRNGSQTTRNLVADQDPAIQAILRSFAEPLRMYLSEIGDDPNHPFTKRNRGSASITEGWSVQLHRGGFHVNHIHPRGWISSSYYVEVPAEVNEPTLKSGWLKFGEPRYSVPGAVADHYVQPEAGLLVLFPSYMWHGTNLIHGAEARTTIAFDAMPG
jgi:Flp pilus assembly protein TadD